MLVDKIGQQRITTEWGHIGVSTCTFCRNTAVVRHKMVVVLRHHVSPLWVASTILLLGILAVKCFNVDEKFPIELKMNDIDENDAADAFFGFSSVIAGNKAFIGAPGMDTGGALFECAFDEGGSDIFQEQNPTVFCDRVTVSKYIQMIQVQ